MAEAIVRVIATLTRWPLSRYAEGIGLALLVAFFALMNACWIWRYRCGKPFDIDEAGYLGFSLFDYHAFVSPDGGPVAWWQAVTSPSIYAPVMMGLSSLSYVVLGPTEFAGFLTPVLFGIVAVGASYFIGKRLGGTQLGFVAAVLVATCPAMINWARNYNFPMPAAAITTLTVLALLKSERFTRIGWSVAFGVSLGLLPLSRSMCLAFVPGIVIAAACQVMIGERRLTRAAVFVGSLALAGLVSATWLARSGLLVWQYLFSYGYGARSVDSGHKENLFSYSAWLDTVRQLSAHMHFPYLAVLAVGALSLGVLAVRSIQLNGWRRALGDLFASPILPVLLVLAEGVIALTSTGNKGTGFIVTFVPLMLVVSAWSILNISKGSATVASLTMATAAFLCLPLLDLSLPFARPWTASVPFLGVVTITDGRGYIQIWEGGRMDQRAAVGWRVANRLASQGLVANGPAGVRIGLGFQNPFVNANTISIERWLETAGGNGHTFYPPLNPAATGDSVAGYVRWLNEREPTPLCLLLTEAGETAHFGSVITQQYMEEAARRTGFVPVASWPLPDGAVLTLRRRSSTCGA